MRIEKALDKRDRARESYRSIFRSAASFGTVHSKMLEERRVVLDSLAGCPSWVKSYLSGIWDELQNQAYSNNLVHGCLIGGVFYSTHSKRPDYYGNKGITPSDYAQMTHENPHSGHYWILSNGNVKPFFTTANR